MTRVRKRRRGTAIVETEKGILVTAGKSRIFLLPGGGAGKGESRIEAAVRELREETGLKSYNAKVLFRHKGYPHKSHKHGYFMDYHTVCLIRADGAAKPHKEIAHVAYYKPGSDIRISRTTKEILHRYYRFKESSRLKQENTSLFHRIMDWLS